MKLLPNDPSNSVPHMELSGWEVSDLWDILNSIKHGRNIDTWKSHLLLTSLTMELHKKESSWKPDSK